MRLRRRVLQAGLVVVGLSLLAAPVTAQSVNRAAIDDLNEQLLYVALPLTLFVELTLVYVITGSETTTTRSRLLTTRR